MQRSEEENTGGAINETVLLKNVIFWHVTSFHVVMFTDFMGKLICVNLLS
jgi:hypothetical protein